MDPASIAAVIVGSCALIALSSGLRVISEYERGVVLRFGRRGPLLEPGLRFILPFGIDRLVRVDLRSAVLPVPAHEVITRDGVPVRVGAVVHLQVLNPLLAVTRVIDYRRSTSQLVQTALREVIARLGLRELLLDQEHVRTELARFVESRAEPWGIRITSVDVREVKLPEAMERAMARHAEIRGEQQAEHVHAATEVESARQLAAAARILESQPYAVQLRFLQALTEIAQGNATVVVVPLPMELVQPLIDLQGHASRSSRPAPGATPGPSGTPPFGASAREASRSDPSVRGPASGE